MANAANHYWIVAGSTAQVWSSARVQYVPVTDATYTAWLDAGNRATPIESEASLQGVLAANYPAGWPQTPAQQALAAAAAGLTITSTSTPALSGTFSVSASSLSYIQGEMLAVAVNATFADGTTSVVWQDMAGTSHTFNVAQFKAFSIAVANYVANLGKVIGGLSTTLPASTATIA